MRHCIKCWHGAFLFSWWNASFCNLYVPFIALLSSRLLIFLGESPFQWKKNLVEMAFKLGNSIIFVSLKANKAGVDMISVMIFRSVMFASIYITHWLDVVDYISKLSSSPCACHLMLMRKAPTGQFLWGHNVTLIVRRKN